MTAVKVEQFNIKSNNITLFETEKTRICIIFFSFTSNFWLTKSDKIREITTFLYIFYITDSICSILITNRREQNKR